MGCRDWSAETVDTLVQHLADPGCHTPRAVADALGEATLREGLLRATQTAAELDAETRDRARVLELLAQRPRRTLEELILATQRRRVRGLLRRLVASGRITAQDGPHGRVYTLPDEIET